MDELIVIYGTDTLAPPGSHLAVAVVGSLYLGIVVGLVVTGLAAARAARRARARRRSVLEPGVTQLHGQIEEKGYAIPGPPQGATLVEQTIAPFTLMTPAGPVRVAPARPVRLDGGDTAGAPLKAGHYVEVAGVLQRETKASAEGYRGAVVEGWILTEGESEPMQLWRHSRSKWPGRRRDVAIGALLGVLALALLSALSLMGYLGRLALGETVEGTLVAAQAHDGDLELTIDLGDGEPVRELVRPDELERWAPGAPIAYRRLAALPWLGAVGPGAAVPIAGLFWTVLFLFAAVGVTGVALAMAKDGG